MSTQMPKIPSNNSGDLLGKIGNLINQAGGPGLQLGEKIVQNPGQFVKNTAGGAGNLIKSTFAIPGNVINSVKKGTEPQDLQNLASNTISQYENIANNPSQALYNDPVGTIAAVAPGVGAAGKLGEVGGAAEAGSIPGGIAKDIPDNAAQSFNSRYNVPTKRAGTNDLNTIKTSKEILAHVKSGMDINSVDHMPEAVTGNNGIITHMTRDAVANIPGEIDMGEPTNSAANILNANKVWVNDTLRQNVLDDVNRGQPIGSNIVKMNPLDAFDYARQLEGKAAKARASSTYLNPRPEMETVAEAYGAAADEVMNQIDTAGKGVPVNSVKTPERIQALQQISPRLAAQVQNATDVSSLRSPAAPFVRLSKMQQLDQAAKNSTFSQVAQGMKKPPIQPLSAAGAGIGGMVGGVPGAAVGYAMGNIGDRALAPEYGTMMSKLEQPVQDAMLKRRLNGKGTPLPPIGKLVRAVGASGAISEKLPQNQQQDDKPQSTQHMAGSVSKSVTSVNDIPGVLTDLTNGNDNHTIQSPDSIATPDGQTIGISNQAYQKERQQLVTQYSKQVVNSPQLAAVTKGQIDNLDTKYNDPMNQKLNTNYATAQNSEQTINTALNTLKTVSPNLSQLFGTGSFSFDALRTSTDPKYDTLKQELNNITAIYPPAKDMLAAAKTQKGVENVIRAAHLFILDNYYSTINAASGGQTAQGTPASQQAQVPPASATAAMPKINTAGWGGAGASPQMPSVPNMQQLQQMGAQFGQ